MKVSIEKQKDGTFIAYNIDGDSTIIGTGNSVSEAREDFLFSMEETKDMCKRHGLKEPEILGQVPEFKFDLSSLFEYYQTRSLSLSSTPSDFAIASRVSGDFISG